MTSKTLNTKTKMKTNNETTAISPVYARFADCSIYGTATLAVAGL